MTYNNPEEDLPGFFTRLTKGAKHASCQHEKGEECGTLHYQAFVGYEHQRSLKQMRITFKGCDVRPSDYPLEGYEYCTKEKTRIEGTEPLTFGGPPPPRKNVKGDTATRNKMLIEMGAKKALDEGFITLN